MRASCSLFVLALAVAVLAGCGAAGDDRFIFLDENPNVDPLDEELTTALAAANVQPISRPQPEDADLVALGRALFFDKELSGNRNISCATCHHPTAGTGDNLPVSFGEGGIGTGANREQGTSHFIPRNAPHLFNGGVTGVDSMFWDSRVVRDPLTGVLTTPEPGLNTAAPALPHALQLGSALAAQAMFPVTSREEMRGQSLPGDPDPLRDATTNAGVWDALMDRLAAIPAYEALFFAAYPSVSDFNDFNFGHAARAIAAFERETWTALDSPFDRYLGGDTSALSDAEKRGALLFFGRASCANCHNGPLLSDFEHHAVGAPQVGPGKVEADEDRGLALETGDPADNYKFRTPQLRNIALTGPWMHAGAFTTLEAAVRHHLDPLSSLANFDVSQLPVPFDTMVDTDPTRQAARAAALSPDHPVSVGLSDAEFDDLMAFLHALTDPSSVNLLRDIPDSVPSGLPVKD
ncbi:MAG: cytochrome c peroxidase [Planctomycetota bacterium]|nr:cytochrome c peroxidase [Planctomycetota bacterium]